MKFFDKPFHLLQFVLMISFSLVAGKSFGQSSIILTAPLSGSVWTSGNSGLVTWTKTNVSAQTVKILLSVNGGQTYGTVLLANAPNSGSATVTIPNLPSTHCRIRVEAIGQSFSGSSNADFTIQTSLGIVEKPVISPGSGTVVSGTNFIITCSTQGADIYYTTNGNTPVIGTSFTKLFAGPFGSNSSITVKAIAVKNAYNTSSLAISTITVTGALPQVATPVINPGTGTYTIPQAVSISCSTPNSTIYYTTNGNVPVVGSTFTKVYTSSITMTETGTVRALAVAAGFTQSLVSVANFTLPSLAKVATPIISPGTGTLNGPVHVIISSSTPGATIYYTTSGNEPVPGTSFTKVYTSSFVLNANTTIRAMAQKTTLIQSATAVSFLTIIPTSQVATPFISLATGSYSGNQSVTLFCNTQGATIYYTTSGNTPNIGTSFTKVYTGPISVSANTTIRALAVKNGMTNSNVSVSFLTIIGGNGRMAFMGSENETNTSSKWTASPNPTSGLIRISVPESLSASSDVLIFNGLGSEVKRLKLDEGFQNGQILLDDLKPGIYFMRIEHPDFPQIERIVKH